MGLTETFILLFVLAIVTVIGHGIWVMLATLFSLGRSEARLDTHKSDQCPRCRTALTSEETACPVCNWPAPLVGGENLAGAAEAVARQLAKYSLIGKLKTTSSRKLIDALHHARQQIEQSEAAAGTPDVMILDAEIVEAEIVPPTAETEQGTVANTQTAGTSTPDVSPAAASVADVEHSAAERAAAFAASRSEASLEPILVPESEVELGESPQTSPRIGNLLNSFLEEKNIRWGEVIGGLLIICCSTALVISFWSEIAARPFLKFCIFNGVSAALFGIGFYTDRKWNLHTTSHGVLIIAILLVPLNFLAIAAFTDKSPPTDLFSLGGEGLSLALFSLLTYFAARTITPSVPTAATVAVMLPSLMQLLVRRFVSPAADLPFLYGIGSVPIATYILAAAVAVARLQRKTELEERDANRLFVYLGIISYAALLPLALLLYKSGDAATTLCNLAPLAGALGIPCLLVGSLFLKTKANDELTTLQTAGMAVGVLGTLMLFAAHILAWPMPHALALTGFCNFVAFGLVSRRFQIPEANLLTGISGAVAWLAGSHIVQSGQWISSAAELSRALISTDTAIVLTPLVALYGLVGFVWHCRHQNRDAVWWFRAAGVLAAASIALMVTLGLGRTGDPAGATWFFAIYAIACGVLGFPTGSRGLSMTTSLLLFVALAQGIGYRYGMALTAIHATALIFLSHATLVVLLGNLLPRREHQAKESFANDLHVSGLLTSVGGAAASLVAVASLSWETISLLAGWLALLWLFAALATVNRIVFDGAQLAIWASALFATTAMLADRAWYVQAAQPWLDPRFMQVQGLVVAAFCLAWQLARRCVPRPDGAPTSINLHEFSIRRSMESSAGAEARLSLTERLQHVLWRPVLSSPTITPISFDELCRWALFATALFLATYAAIPGAAQELAPSGVTGSRVVPAIAQFELRGVPSLPAGGVGSWLVLAAAVLVLTVAAIQDRSGQAATAALVLLLASSFLVSSRWHQDVAVASALRWCASLFALLASVPIWCRVALQSWLRRRGIRADMLFACNSAQTVKFAVIAFVVAIYAVMSGYVGIKALELAGLPDIVESILPLVAFSSLTAIAVGIASFNNHWNQPGISSRRRLIASRVVTVVASGPLLIALLFSVSSALRQHPLVGPETGSWFRDAGWSVSYGVPLAIFAVTLLGYAIRDASSLLAFAAGLLGNLIATMVYLLGLTGRGRPLDAVAWTEVTYVNAMVAAVLAIAWGIAWRWAKKTGRVPADSTPIPLAVQACAAMLVCSVPIVLAAADLFVYPKIHSWVVTAGGPLGWVTLSLAVAALTVAALATGRRATVPIIQRMQDTPPHLVGWALLTLSGLLAVTSAQWDTGNWLAYHVLLVSLTVSSWVMVWLQDVVGIETSNAGDEQRDLPQRRNVSLALGGQWSVIFAGLVTVVAARAIPADPSFPLPTLLALGATTLLSWTLAWRAARRDLVWIGGAFAHWTASLAWVEYDGFFTGLTQSVWEVQLYLCNAAVAALVAIVSLVIDLRRCQKMTAAPRWILSLSYHRVMTWAALLTVAGLVGLGLLADARGGSFQLVPWFATTTLVATLVAVVGCFRDPLCRHASGRLYVGGLVATAMFLDGLNLRGDLLWWSATLGLAAYALTSSYLWSGRARWMPLLAPARVAGSAAGEVRTGQHWVVICNSILAAVVTLWVFQIELLLPSTAQRISASHAILACAIAVACLAQGAVRSALQTASLSLGGLFAVAFGLAWLPLDLTSPWLHRLITAAVGLAAAMTVISFAVVRSWREENEWTRAGQRVNVAFFGVGTALLFTILGLEVQQYLSTQQVAIAWAALVAVAAALAGLSVCAVVAAVVPGRDPLGLSDRGREAYIYGAEVLLGLLFVHIRVTMPWLFSGWFLQFWPLIVMGLAFLGVGLSQWSERRRQTVLANPLENSGAVLPIVPVIGFWILPSGVDYSLLLLSTGALYMVLSFLRKSFLFAALAGLACNASLWFLLHSSPSFGFLQHPQMWLIPPALCVLIAAHLNQRRLSTEQLTSTRYLAAIVIYASSTVEVFINGVGQAPWLPLILAGISILGMLAGILLRIRAFLFLGFSFLLVSMLTMIWHAAVELEMTWVWWVSGIVTGVLIIALFGLFEKKRDDMLKLVEQVGQWEP